jgi:DNA anti-recombination protein RmuC
VFPVSPNTLVIALRSVEMSISHYEQAKGVEKTLEQIRLAQKHFGNFQKKFEDVGDGLERAQKAYAIATNHLARFEKSTIQLTGEETPELTQPEPPAATGQA